MTISDKLKKRIKTMTTKNVAALATLPSGEWAQNLVPNDVDGLPEAYLRYHDCPHTLQEMIYQAIVSGTAPALREISDKLEFEDILFESGAMDSRRFKEKFWGFDHMSRGVHFAGLEVGGEWAGIVSANRSVTVEGDEVRYRISDIVMFVRKEHHTTGGPEALLSSLLEQVTSDVEHLAERLSKKNHDTLSVKLDLDTTEITVSNSKTLSLIKTSLLKHWDEVIEDRLREDETYDRFNRLDSGCKPSR